MRGLPVLVLAIALATGCGAGPDASAPPPREPAAVAAPAGVSDPRVSVELRRSIGGKAACAEGDVCGYFLQIVSPESDPKDLADKAVRMIKGKCGGHVVVYRDPRNVMGAGTVFATADEKSACEKALGRAADKDFPNYLVWRVAP